MAHPFFSQEKKEAMVVRIKRGDRILWNIRTIVMRNKDGEKVIPVRQVQVNMGAVPNLYQGAVPFLIEDLFKDTDFPIDALLKNSLTVAEVVDSYQTEQMDCYLLDFVVGPKKEAVFIEYNIGVGTYWNYEELLRILSPDRAGEGVDPFIENAIRRGSEYKKRRGEERFNTAQANIRELFSMLQATIDPIEQEELKQNLEAAIDELHRAIPQDKINEIRELGRRINQGEDLIEDLYNKLSAVLCLDLLKHIEIKYDSWIMPDGRFMNANQHNREVMNALKLFGWADEDKAYSYFNGRREQGKIPLDHRNFSETRAMFKTSLLEPEAAFTIALTYALHDYGKMVSIGEHPEYGARLAKSFLERLVASEYTEQIASDIEEHTSLSRVINGEAPLRKVRSILSIGEEMWKRQAILRFIDASSIGQGMAKSSYLEDTMIYGEEYLSKLAANWGKARILYSIRYSGQVEIKLEDIAKKGIDKIFDDYVVQLAPDVWKEIETLGLTKEFLDFLNDIDFLYAANIHRRLDIRSFSKWLFIMFVVHKASQSQADTIQYASDLNIEDVLRYVNVPLAIMEIYNSIEVTESDTIKKVKLLHGLTAIVVKGNILMIGTDPLKQIGELIGIPLSGEDRYELPPISKMHTRTYLVNSSGYVHSKSGPRKFQFFLGTVYAGTHVDISFVTSDADRSLLPVAITVSHGQKLIRLNLLLGRRSLEAPDAPVGSYLTRRKTSVLDEKWMGPHYPYVRMEIPRIAPGGIVNMKTLTETREAYIPGGYTGQPASVISVWSDAAYPHARYVPVVIETVNPITWHTDYFSYQLVWKISEDGSRSLIDSFLVYKHDQGERWKDNAPVIEIRGLPLNKIETQGRLKQILGQRFLLPNNMTNGHLNVRMRWSEAVAHDQKSSVGYVITAVQFWPEGHLKPQPWQELKLIEGQKKPGGPWLLLDSYFENSPPKVDQLYGGRFARLRISGLRPNTSGKILAVGRFVAYIGSFLVDKSVAVQLAWSSKAERFIPTEIGFVPLGAGRSVKIQFKLIRSGFMLGGPLLESYQNDFYVSSAILWWGKEKGITVENMDVGLKSNSVQLRRMNLFAAIAPYFSGGTASSVFVWNGKEYWPVYLDLKSADEQVERRVWFTMVSEPADEPAWPPVGLISTAYGGAWRWKWLRRSSPIVKSQWAWVPWRYVNGTNGKNRRYVSEKNYLIYEFDVAEGAPVYGVYDWPSERLMGVWAGEKWLTAQELKSHIAEMSEEESRLFSELIPWIESQSDGSALADEIRQAMTEKAFRLVLEGKTRPEIEKVLSHMPRDLWYEWRGRGLSLDDESLDTKGRSMDRLEGRMATDPSANVEGMVTQTVLQRQAGARIAEVLHNPMALAALVTKFDLDPLAYGWNDLPDLNEENVELLVSVALTEIRQAIIDGRLAVSDLTVLSDANNGLGVVTPASRQSL